MGLITFLWMVWGLALAILLFFLGWWWRESRTYQQQLATETEGREWKEFRYLIGRGHIFCTLFNVTDIEVCANQMGIAFLTQFERAQIINRIRRDFDPDRGLSYPIIKEAIRQWMEERKG